MSSNGLLHLSPATSTSKPHMPSPFERLDTGPWLDGLLEKIARGRERPPSPSPSRSPSPEHQNDVFGDGGEDSARLDGYGKSVGDHSEGDLLGEGEEDEDEDEEQTHDDFELSAVQGDEEYADAVAAGILPSSVLEDALRNTGEYMQQDVDQADEDYDAEANGFESAPFVDRDQAYSGEVYDDADGEVQYGVDDEQDDQASAVNEEDDEDEVEDEDEDEDDNTHESAYGAKYAEDLDEYDEDEEVDEDDGMGEPLSDPNDVIEIGDTDDEEEAEEDEDREVYGEEYDEDEEDAEEEEQEEVEDDEETDAAGIEEYGYNQGDYRDLYNDLPEQTDMGATNLPYLSSEIFDALDQQPITALETYGLDPSYSAPGALDSQLSDQGSALDAAHDGLPDPPVFSPYNFDSAAVETHNAERNLYPAIPTDTASDLEAILSQPVVAASKAVSDDLIDPELQAPTPMQESEPYTDLPESLTGSIYPSLPEASVVAVDISEAPTFSFLQAPISTADASPSDPGIEDDLVMSQALGVQSGSEHEDEDVEVPLSSGPDDRSPGPLQTAQDSVIEVLSSDGEEDEEMEEKANESSDWIDRAAMDAGTPAPIGDEVDELEEDEPLAPQETAFKEIEPNNQPGASTDGPVISASISQPTPPILESIAPASGTIDFATPAPSFDFAPRSDNVEDEPTPEPLDPRWAMRSSPPVPTVEREELVAVPLNEVVVEELEDRLPVGLDEMVRQVIAAAEAEVAEPVTAHNTPAVDDGLNIAEFFAPPQDEAEVVVEETVVVETGTVETPGLGSRSPALDLSTGFASVEAAPDLATITEEQTETVMLDVSAVGDGQSETAETVEAPQNELVEDEKVADAKESLEPTTPVAEQAADVIEADDLAADPHPQLTESDSLDQELAPVDDEARSTELEPATSVIDGEAQHFEIAPHIAVPVVEDSSSVLPIVSTDIDSDRKNDDSAATERDATGPIAVEGMSEAGDDLAPSAVEDSFTAVIDDSDEVVVVQPLPKTDSTRLSPVATSSISRRPSRPTGIRPSHSPVMPIPILLRSPAHTPPASEDVVMQDDERVYGVDAQESQSASPVPLPDPHAPVPDTQLPPALSPGEHPHSQLTRSPSMVVEPPLNPPEPDMVPAPELRQREETPPMLPDPALPPADTTVPLPLSPGQIRDRPTPSPSLIVEPPENPPAPETVVKVPTRENTPVSLPDPHAAPPDSTSAVPLSPHHMELNDATPTPSIIVEPPTEALTPFLPISAGGSRADTPPVLPDPHAASPDIRRDAQLILDDVPRQAERAASLSPSVEAVVAEDVPGSTAAEVSEPAVSVVDYGKATDAADKIDEHDELETRSATSDKTEKGETTAGPTSASRPALFMTESMRLRHHHGGPPSSVIHPGELGEPGITHTVTQTHRRTRSSARSSTDLVPPVTRSHCFYRKLQLQGNGMSALVLVPQCTLYERERLEEETSADLGEATAEEEREAESRAMTEEHPILHPHLELKLHRIVGKAIFDEGHCYLLKADEKALRPAESAEILTVGSHSHPNVTTPKRKKRAPDDMDEDDVLNVPQSVTRSQARRSKRQSVSRELKAEGSNTQSTPTKSPAPRSRGLRSVSRLSEAKSDSGAGEMVRSGTSISPVKRTPRANRRSLSVATASQGSLDEDVAADLDTAPTTDSIEEREQTPIVVSVTTVPASEGTRTRRGRQAKQSPMPEDVQEEIVETAEEEAPAIRTTPTKKAAKTKVSAKPRSSARKSVAAAQEDAPYRPDEAEEAALEQDQTAGDDDNDDDSIRVHVETSGPSGTKTSFDVGEDKAKDADEVPVASDAAAEAQQPVVRPASKKGRKNAESFAAETAVERRKSTRLTAKAKEDEAPYRPEEETESVASDLEDEANVDETKEKESESAPKSRGQAKGTKRKARGSAGSAQAVEEVGDDTTAETQVEGRATRSAKKRAVASAQEPDVPVAQDLEAYAVAAESEQDGGEENEKVEQPPVPVQEEKKSRGWFSFFGRGKK